jgi:hypothetical protein
MIPAYQLRVTLALQSVAQPPHCDDCGAHVQLSNNTTEILLVGDDSPDRQQAPADPGVDENERLPRETPGSDPTSAEHCQ